MNVIEAHALLKQTFEQIWYLGRILYREDGQDRLIAIRDHLTRVYGESYVRAGDDGLYVANPHAKWAMLYHWSKGATLYASDSEVITYAALVS